MHPRYNTIFPQLFNNQKMTVTGEVNLSGKHCDIDLMFLTYPDGAETSIMVAHALGFWSAHILDPFQLPKTKFSELPALVKNLEEQLMLNILEHSPEDKNHG